MKLRPLNLADETEARLAHVELERDNFGFLLGGYSENDNWAEFIARLGEYQRGENLQPGFVPATFLVADVNGAIVGRTSIRHELNDYLMERGGHIGYGVRPAFRRLGYATRILQLSLERARELGIENALVTCNDENIGSSKAIEKCGGVLENVIQIDTGEILRRYWVSTQPESHRLI